MNHIMNRIFSVIIKNNRVLLTKANGKWACPNHPEKNGEMWEETLAKHVKENSNLDIKINGIVHVHKSESERMIFIRVSEFSGNVENSPETIWLDIDRLDGTGIDIGHKFAILLSRYNLERRKDI